MPRTTQAAICGCHLITKLFCQRTWPTTIPRCAKGQRWIVLVGFVVSGASLIVPLIIAMLHRRAHQPFIIRFHGEGLLLLRLRVIQQL